MSLYTCRCALCAILGVVEGVLGAQRRAFGALCGHDGRMECHQDFSIEFSNYAHYDRHIDTCGVVSRLLVLPTRGAGHGPEHTRIRDLWDPYWAC